MSQMPDTARMKRELAEIISIRTENPPGREADAAVYVQNLLVAAGFDVSLTEYKPGRFNVEARLENGLGPVLPLIPTWIPCRRRGVECRPFPASRGRWQALRPRRMRLQGTPDRDGGSPADAGFRRQSWSGTLLGVFVGDEEIASEGAKFYAAGKPKIDFAVVGEPTSNTTFSAHKGNLRPVVRVYGLSAHSGTPHLGENAIYRAAQLLGMIETHHDKVVRLRAHPLVGEASLTVTRIWGGHQTMCCRALAICCLTAGWSRARTKRL